MRRDGHDKKSLILALAGILMPVIILVFLSNTCIGFVDRYISPHFSNVLFVILVVGALGLQIASLVMKRTEPSNHKVLRLIFEIFFYTCLVLNIILILLMMAYLIVYYTKNKPVAMTNNPTTQT